MRKRDEDNNDTNDERSEYYQKGPGAAGLKNLESRGCPAVSSLEIIIIFITKSKIKIFITVVLYFLKYNQ